MQDTKANKETGSLSPASQLKNPAGSDNPAGSKGGGNQKAIA